MDSLVRQDDRRINRKVVSRINADDFPPGHVCLL